MNDAPIGIFDSGVGGLTVARAISAQLPRESMLYIGDTAHSPYGPRPIADVRRYSLEVLDTPFENIEEMDAVWRAINGLSVDLRMALLLRDVVGLSYTEIADSLEITLATVKWRIYKAREEVQLSLVRDGIQIGSNTRKAAPATNVVELPGR